jgi:hypothetical protein
VISVTTRSHVVAVTGVTKLADRRKAGIETYSASIQIGARAELSDFDFAFSYWPPLLTDTLHAPCAPRFLLLSSGSGRSRLHGIQNPPGGGFCIPHHRREADTRVPRPLGYRKLGIRTTGAPLISAVAAVLAADYNGATLY